MENKCWKGRDGTHAFGKVEKCKWQMGDPKTRMKFSLSDCTWLEKIEYGLVFKALQDLNEAKKNRGAFLFFSFLRFFFLFLFFLPSSFFILHFLCSSELLSNIVLAIVFPSPMLKWLLVLEHRSGNLWLLENYEILVFLYKSFEIFMGILHVKLAWSLMSPCICYMSWNLTRKSSENSSKDHPYSIWVVVKEVIKKMFWV
jgi:hypothetical protein